MLVLNDMTADARVDREAAALAAGVTTSWFSRSVAEVLPKRSGATVSTFAGSATIRLRDGGVRGPSSPSRLLEPRPSLKWPAAASAPDIVHVHDVDTLVAGNRVRELTGCALVYDAHELYSDMVAEFGSGGSWPVQTYWKRIERTLIPTADEVITVSDGLAETLADRHSVNPVVLRNVPPLAPLLATDRLRRELEIEPSAVVVLYQGVLISGRGLTNRSEPWLKSRRLRWSFSESGPRNGPCAKQPSHHWFLIACSSWATCRRRTCMTTHAGQTLASSSMRAPHSTTDGSAEQAWAYGMAGLPVVASNFPGLDCGQSKATGWARCSIPPIEASLASAIGL